MPSLIGEKLMRGKNVFCESGEKPELMLMNKIDEWIRIVHGVYKEAFESEGVGNMSFCKNGLSISSKISVQFSSVAQSCPTLCDPMNCSTPGLPVHHQLPEFTQTHIHQVGDAISSLVVPFSSCPQSLPASESFPISQLFA